MKQLGEPQPAGTMLKVGRMPRARLNNILTYLKHRIANAASEAIDSPIPWVKATARGLRDRQTFINAIYSHRGGLDLDRDAATH